MKKTLIALAVAGFSFNAAAADLTVSPVVPAKYASEIKLPAVLKDSGTDALDVTVKLGFSATAGVKRYVRFDLTNAVFATAVTTGNLTEANAVALSPVISTGGAKGDNFVVIEISPAADLKNTDKLTLDLADIKATGGNASIQYRLYETGVDAANATGSTLASKSGALANFEPGLITEVTYRGADMRIDVAEESKLFDGWGIWGDKAARISVLNIEVENDILAADGTLLTLDTLLDSATVEVAGDFSAGAKDGNGNLNKKEALLLDNAPPSSLTASKAVYAFKPSLGFTAGGELKFTVDGETSLDNQSISAKFVPVAKTGYTLADVDLGVVGELEKNGDSQTVNLALKPGGAFSNYVRISNTSGLAGKFFITVIADDGQQVGFPLSAVEGQEASIDARASTTQMSVQQIFDAAADRGLSLSGEGKLRLVVDGEVPSLNVQSYTVATDGTTFSAF